MECTPLSPRQTYIEALLENGEISCNKQVVLDKWILAFFTLYNAGIDSDLYTNDGDIHGNERMSDCLVKYISVVEILQALTKANKGKASGID